MSGSGGDGDGLTDGRDGWQAGDAVEDGISTSVSVKPLNIFRGDVGDISSCVCGNKPRGPKHKLIKRLLLLKLDWN